MTSRRFCVSLLAALATAAAVGGCGISADDDPQAIARTDLPPDLLDPNPASSTTLGESAGTTTVDVYLLEDVRGQVWLEPVDREVTEVLPDERLAALFGGATEEEIEKGITSNIPRDTQLLDVTIDREEREVTVDLSDDIFTVEGAALAQAFAQMVYTATEADAYQSVRFLVEGEPTAVLKGDGTETVDPVRRGHYDEFERDAS